MPQPSSKRNNLSKVQSAPVLGRSSKKSAAVVVVVEAKSTPPPPPQRSLKSGIAKWFSRSVRNPQHNTEKSNQHHHSTRLSFLRLAKERRFDEITCVLQQLSASDTAASTTTTEAWLTLAASNDKSHVVSSCESLHALCMYRPTVAVVQAVMDALTRIHGNAVDVTVMVDAAGRTPLHICAAFGACGTVAELLMLDSTAVLTPDQSRRYPLHWACAHPHGTMGHMIPHVGHHKNTTSNNNNSRKATDNMAAMISQLIEAYPVAVISPDSNGHTPLDLAVAANADARIVSALRFVVKILPSPKNFGHLYDNDPQNQTASMDTESTFLNEIPAVAVCDDGDDLSSVGSRGVSRHVRRYINANQRVPSLVVL